MNSLDIFPLNNTNDTAARLPTGPSFSGIRLDANERGMDMPPEIKAVLAREINRTPLQSYPNDTLLRDDLARWWQLDPAQVVIGCGSDELIQMICLALARERSFIIPTPTFSMYAHCAEITGVHPVAVPLKDNFSLDGPAVLAAARRHPGPIIICQPNNPTGQRFDDRTLRLILDNAPGPVILDEAYGEFTGQNYRPWLDQYPQLILLRTFSKAMGLAGLRIGYSLSSQCLAEKLNKVRAPFNVSSLSLLAARISLRYPDYWQNSLPEVVRERERLAAFLQQKLNCRVYPSETNFILFAPPAPAKTVWAACRERGVLLRDLSDTEGLNNHLRVSVGSRAENELCMEVLERVLGDQINKVRCT